MFNEDTDTEKQYIFLLSDIGNMIVLKKVYQKI